MLRKLTVMFAFVFLAFGLLVSSAVAAVSYDPATGGTVGKGDVQMALGLNNAGLQSAVKNGTIVFTYNATATYSQVCSKTIEQKKETKVVSNTFSDTQTVSATVQYDTKVKNQIVGFILAPISSGIAAPMDLCPNDNSGFVAEDELGNATAPELVSSTGGLFVNGVAL